MSAFWARFSTLTHLVVLKPCCCLHFYLQRSTPIILPQRPKADSLVAISEQLIWVPALGSSASLQGYACPHAPHPAASYVHAFPKTCMP